MTPEEIRAAWPEIESELKPGDILMIRDRHNWLAKRIQKLGRSYWNHMSIILLSKQHLPIGGPLIIEASYSGIEIHQIRKYTADFGRYDLGIMRIPDISDYEREQLAMKFILSNLDREYDYVRLAAILLSSFLLLILPKLALKAFIRFTDRSAFICTTFVHRAIHKHSVHAPSLANFKSDDPAVQEIIREEMITPGDIAREPYLEWVFNKHL